MSAAGRRGAVAAGHPLTAEAAADVLADGGNAFDAAIAALWTACVCEPILASPGGGGFLTAMSGGRTRVFDFFAAAPSRKSPESDIEFAEVSVDFGTATQSFHVGAGASAAPGFVPGLFAVHEALASLPMRRLAEPAAAAARAGVAVTALQAYLFDIVGPICRWTKDAEALFAPEGKLPDAGAMLRNPALADAIETIGREGARIATEGEIAQAMAGVCARHGGHLRPADFAGYRTELREPLDAIVGDFTVRLNPPPALGGALVAAMLSALDPRSAGDQVARAGAIDDVDRFWRQAPGDPGRLVGVDGPKPAQAAQRGTTHVSVIDASGNAAAATVSNGEGNGRLVDGCGFMLNNMLGEEDLNPGGFHAWTPGARLGSMMTPAVATRPDGAVIALGSGGSNRIRTAIMQTLLNRCAGAMRLAAAIEAPRVHVERGHLDFEDFLAGGQRERLVAAFADHRAWREPNLYFGGVHAVERDPGGNFDAAGDPRRGGVGRLV